MNELRKDYILDRWVIISTGRGKRPEQFKRKPEEKTAEVCFFCPGNEHMTPPEIERIEENGKWTVRVFPNKFPFVEMQGDPEIKRDNEYYTYSSSFGKHEVVAVTPNHDKDFSDLSEQKIKQILEVYRRRINEISKIKGIKYVAVFHNHGRDAGSSLPHEHTQIAGTNELPTLIEQEANCNKHLCNYCRIIENEKKSDRRCYENDTFVAFTPYASRYPFEIWIFPKQHKKTINDFNDKELTDLSQIMKKIFLKLKELNAPYNFVIDYSPEGENLHFHIEFLPRLNIQAGFELLTETIVNTMTPEDAAKFYRGE